MPAEAAAVALGAAMVSIPWTIAVVRRLAREDSPDDAGARDGGLEVHADGAFE
jgi:hypothetical protein